MQYQEKYANVYYSPRARTKDIPFWYRQNQRRRIWGLLLL